MKKTWKQMKRMLALFMALSITVSTMNLPAWAADKGPGCGLEAHVHGDGCYELTCNREHEDTYTIVEDTKVYDEHIHGAGCYADAPSCGKVEHTHDEGCYPEKIPAEVQDFLDAVAGIPAITPENAAEVAEYVYGPVSEAYETLLGTGYEERADVLEAVEAYAAAISAIDFALNMESISYSPASLSGITIKNYIGYHEKLDDLDAGAVTKWVGDSLPYNYCPTDPAYCGYCGNVLVELVPDYYAFPNPYHAEEYNASGDGIIEYKGYEKAWYPLNRSYAGLQFNYSAEKPGTVTAELIVAHGYKPFYTTGYCDNRYCQAYARVYNDSYYYGVNPYWYQRYISFDVTVNARYQLNYDTQGGSAVSPTYADKSTESATLAVTSAQPTKSGYTFKGWSETPDGKTPAAGSYTLNWSTGLGGKNNPVSKILYAIWEETKTYTVIYQDYQDSLKYELFGKTTTGNLKAGDNTPVFSSPGVDKITEWGANQGYTFQGWTLNGTLLTPAGTVHDKVLAADADANGNIVYTATWKKNAEPTTYTVVHEYYANGEKDGSTKQENISGKNVGDTVEVKDIEKVLKYTKNGVENTYTYTRANQGVAANNPYGYTLGGVITQLELAESGNIIVLRYDRTIKHNVVYSWTGLPDNHGQTLPTGGSYAENTEVTVNSTYTNTTEVTVDGTTYVFSGWSTTDATIKNGKFTMPGKNVIIRGTWSVKVPNPKLEKLEKVRLTEAPADVTLDLKGKTVNYDQNVVFVGDNAPAVTLLYKITVTGTEGARYKVTDTGATRVGGDPLEGTIAEGKTQAVIYVTKDFTKADIVNGKLTNNATLESNDPVDPNKPNEGGTEGPEGENGKGSGSADAKKQYNVTINFKTEDGNKLQDSNKTTVDEGADFNYSVEQANARKARANSDVSAVVIPRRLGANNEYVLDMVASAAGLAKLAAATDIHADVEADIIYSLDVKGAVQDGADTPDGIPDKYQVKVTFKVVNGKWDDDTNADVVKYVVKYAADGVTMAADGTATLGSIIPAVGSKPDQGYETDSWDTEPTAETTVTGDATYTYTYKLHVHNYVEVKNDDDTTKWVTAPDCITDGTVTVKCACGDTKTEVKTPKYGHSFPEAWTDPCGDHNGADCPVHTKTCTRCNGTLTDGTQSEGHTYGEWTVKTPATIDAAGVEHQVCTACGHELTRPLDKLKVNVIFKDGDTELKRIPDWDKDGEVTEDLFPELPEAPVGKEFQEWVKTVDPETGDIIYTIVWKDKTYTVTFNSNGGSAVEGQTVKHGETAAQPAAPARDGYTFNGWYLNGVAYDFNTPVTENITLEARWTVIDNGGDDGDDDDRRPTNPTEPTEPEPNPEPTVPEPVEPGPVVEPEPEPAQGPEVEDVADMPDDQVPLADLPKEAEELEEFENMADEDVPLAGVPETGDPMLAWASAAALSGLGLAFLSRKKKEEI